MEALERVKTGGETGLAETFHLLAESIKRRSLIVVISDLFDDPAALLGALKHFRHKKHDVIVFHTLDPHELTFPFDDVTKIEDMETRREVDQRPAGLPEVVPGRTREVPRNGPRGLPVGPDRLRAGADRPPVRRLPRHVPRPPLDGPRLTRCLN